MDFIITAILQGLCFSGIALGIFLSLRIFNIPDITTDGSYTLGGAVTAALIASGWSTGIVLPIVIITGALAGGLTGWIHTRLKVHPILSGILVMIALYSVNLKIMGRSNIPLINQSTLLDIRIVENTLWNDFLWIAMVIFLLIMMIAYLLKTDFGLTMRATGNNENMMRAIGVKTDNIKVIGLALANALTAVSGYLMVQFQKFSDINMGVGIVVIGLGSVMIAEVFCQIFRLQSVFSKLILVCVGAIIFQLALALTLMMGVEPLYLKLCTAIIVLLIVSLPKFGIIKLPA